MRKITLMIIVSLLSFCSYGQLAKEGFESPWVGSPPAPPGGWVVRNEVGTITWVQSTLGSTVQQPVYEGDYAAFLAREDVNPGAPIPSNWLITKQFNSPVNGELHFFSRLTQLGDQGGVYKTMIALAPSSTTPVTDLTWVDLQTWTEITLNPNQTTYTEKIVNIPATYTNQQIRIAFIMQGDNKDRWLIDNVEVITRCSAPTTLSANDITLNSAKLNWVNPAGVTKWDIDIVLGADTPTGVGVEYSGALPYQKNGLLEDTEYKYYVRSVCTSGGKSDWVGPFFFSTIARGENCTAPIIIPAVPGLPYSTTNNTANYSDVYEGTPGTGCVGTGNYLAGNDVVYSYTPATSGTINVSLSNTGGPAGVFIYTSCANIGVSCVNGAVASATAAGVIPALVVTANTTYYFVISTNGTPQTTQYTLTLQQVYCAAPTALTATGQTASSANLSWAVGTATSWQAVIQPAGAGLPPGAGQVINTNTGYLATQTTAGDLFTPATNYEYYLRANCGDGTFSIWTGPFAFSTTQIPGTIPYSDNFDGATHGWSILNAAQPNKWYVGAATSNSPSKSLYISNDNGISNNYTITFNSVTHAYRDIAIPSGSGQIGFSFDIKSGGESATDYIRAWLVPTSFVPTPGTQISAANSGGVAVGGNFHLLPTWTTQNVVINAAAFGGSTRRLVFEWRNNNFTGTQPAGAVDNINIKAVTCQAPTALTLGTTTANSANYSWTAPAGTPPVEYEYFYSSDPLVAPTATTAALGSSPTTSANISPLTSSQTYNVWVRSSCGPTDKSFWTGPVSVTIPQVPATINYTQNFDGGPHEFSFVNGSQPNKWTVGTATSNSPGKSMYITNDGTTNTYVSINSVTQAYRDILIPTTAAEISVKFDWKAMGEDDFNPYDFLRVWMVPVNFVPTAGTQIAAGTDRVQLAASLYLKNTWTTSTFDVPVTAYQGQARRLVFEWKNDGFADVQSPAAIDNINITVVTCPKPQNLTAINVTNTNATLDWTEGGSSTSWEISISPIVGTTIPPAPTGAGTQVTADSSYTPPVGTLVYGTSYVYYVRSNCGGANGMSNWAGPYKFSLRPINDDCANAIVAPTNPALVCAQTVNGTVLGATASSEASTCGGTRDDDVWFEFVATNTAHLINLNNVTGSTADLFHAVYSGNQCGTMTQMYCSDPNNSIASGLVVGQTYKIRVWTWTSTPDQTSAFQLCITTPPPPPLNDECAGAFPVVVNPTLVCAQTTAGTIYSATQSPESTTCVGTKDDDVWFSFVATNTTHKINILNITGGTTDLVHAVYTGDQCGTMTQLYCSDPNDSWANGLTVGQTYKIRVYSWTSTIGQTSAFEVCVGTPPPPPANDECAGAINVPVNPTMICQQTVPGTVQSATSSPEATTCVGTKDDDVWFEFTATNTVHIIELKDVTGSTTDLVHVLYSGNQCGALTQIYCSDPNYSLALGLVVGQKYKIRVYTNTATPNQTAAFNVCVSTPPPPPTNDDCAGAIVVPVNLNSSCTQVAWGSVYASTASPEANTCGGDDADDIWFQFVATNNSHLISLIDIIGSTTDLYHVVYSGDQCGSLTQLYCSDANSSVANGLIIGNTYKIRVYTNTATINQTTGFNVCIRTPNTPISVNVTQFTPEQLVNEVLINSPCALVSNITSRSGATFGDVASLGSFDSNGADFPFDYGVVLSTGGALAAQGPFGGPNVGNTYDWVGDNDLNAIIVANEPTQLSGTRNATVLEFDFIPLTNLFKFNFLFASNEYGTFQCTFSDAFAFILTDSNGVSKNLAVIPNTNIPVGVTTIRDGIYNTGCGSQNIAYFGQYNLNDPLASAINYNGQTKPLIASASVIPGNSYHIKLVIADYSDASWNSAVFLDGGSFDIGSLDLGGDLLVDTGTAICDAQTATLDTQLVGANYIFTWFKDGDVIPGATSSTYEVTESGHYGVQATFANISCSYEGSVVIEFYPPVEEITGDPANLTVCDASGFSTFDLTPNVNAILAGTTTPTDFVNTIHLSAAEAESGDNPIADITAYTNTTAALQTLWIRTLYNVSGCVGIKSFDLVVQDLTPVYTINPDFSICEGTSGTISVVITDTDTTPVTYTWSNANGPLPDTTPSITVTEAGAYTVVLNRTGCTTTSTVNVVVTPTPVADDPADVTACGSYVLPTLSAGNNYYDANGQMLSAFDELFQTQVIEVRASSGTTPNCTASNTFSVTVVPAPVVEPIANVEACDSYTLPAIVGEGNYFTGPGGTGTALSETDVINSTQTIYVFAESNVVITPPCTSETSFVVTVNTTPVVDDPADVTACDSYKLPALTSGNYFTGPDGTGTPLFADQDITQTTTVYVFAQNGNCKDENSFEVRITPTPAFSLGSPQTVCVASNVTINVTPTNNFNVNDATYIWKLEGVEIPGNNSIVAPGFGTYTVTVSIGNCSHTESVKISPDTNGIALIITNGCEGNTYMIGVTDDQGSFNLDTAKFAWTGPQGFTSTEREFTAAGPGTYTVTVTTPDGCMGQKSVEVTDTSCDIQRGISPNGDGLNDNFDLTALNVAKLSIFNRYGQEVYSKRNYKDEWYGQGGNGNELPTGTYFYMIERSNGETTTGWIYINRQE
jgi:gliding motility-associated-like protein